MTEFSFPTNEAVCDCCVHSSFFFENKGEKFNVAKNQTLEGEV